MALDARLLSARCSTKRKTQIPAIRLVLDTWNDCAALGVLGAHHKQMPGINRKTNFISVAIPTPSLRRFAGSQYLLTGRSLVMKRPLGRSRPTTPSHGGQVLAVLPIFSTSLVRSPAHSIARWQISNRRDRPGAVRPNDHCQPLSRSNLNVSNDNMLSALSEATRIGHIDWEQPAWS
jgi:hypothetical protein